MTGICDIPPEILIQILQYLQPRELASCLLVNHHIRSVAHSQEIWQAAHLRNFDYRDGVLPDALSGAASDGPYDWMGMCQQLEFALTVLQSRSSLAKGLFFDRTLPLLDLMTRMASSDHSRPGNVQLLQRLFISSLNEQIFLLRSKQTLTPATAANGPITRSRSCPKTGVRLTSRPMDLPDEHANMCARIHILYGLTIDETAKTTHSARLRAQAKLGTYKYERAEANDFSPMTTQETVDWPFLEDIFRNVASNITALVPLWQDEGANIQLQDLVPARFSSLPSPPCSVERWKRNVYDWARVEEFPFLGTYFFMPWEAFNLYNSASISRAVVDTQEVPGDLMALSLKLLQPQPPLPHDFPKDRPPPLYFKGFCNFTEASGLHLSDVRGSVNLSPEGYPVWEFIHSLSGQDLWLLKGVELGEFSSILGVWTDVEDFATTGPFFWVRQSRRQSHTGDDES